MIASLKWMKCAYGLFAGHPPIPDDFVIQALLQVQEQDHRETILLAQVGENK